MIPFAPCLYKKRPAKRSKEIKLGQKVSLFTFPFSRLLPVYPGSPFPFSPFSLEKGKRDRGKRGIGYFEA